MPSGALSAIPKIPNSAGPITNSWGFLVQLNKLIEFFHSIKYGIILDFLPNYIFQFIFTNPCLGLSPLQYPRQGCPWNAQNISCGSALVVLLTGVGPIILQLIGTYSPITGVHIPTSIKYLIGSTRPIYYLIGWTRPI
jgi:hypothetical protein